MEVMSSLLLCALVCLLPQTLGRIRDNHRYYHFNKTVLIQKPNLHRTYPNLIVNYINQQNNEPDAYFDNECNNCIVCMDRALKKYNIRSPGKNVHSYLPDMHENELMSNIFERHRDRRDVDATVSTASTPNTDTTKKEKRTKSKKNKGHKTVTVTKYNINGEVYALKVKEAITPYLKVDNDIHAKPTQTCRVFSVKKSYPCDSPEGYLILAASKTKRNKQVDETSTVDAASTPNQATPKPGLNTYRKRHIDNTQLPENVVPSMEEFY